LATAERQGLLHGEGFTDFSLADALRPLLYERLLALANNHGLLRLWTREQALFWKHSGLTQPTPEELAVLPVSWRGGATGWLTLKLREDVDALIAADKEFALMLQAEKHRAQKALGRAKAFKAFVIVIAGVLIVGTLIAAFRLWSKGQRRLR
jgi:hypothetical protein